MPRVGIFFLIRSRDFIVQGEGPGGIAAESGGEDTVPRFLAKVHGTDLPKPARLNIGREQGVEFREPALQFEFSLHMPRTRQGFVGRQAAGQGIDVFK